MRKPHASCSRICKAGRNDYLSEAITCSELPIYGPLLPLRHACSCARQAGKKHSTKHQENRTVSEPWMTYVVTEACIKCKYTDCVEVCPVDCFYEGENMLVIHPDECIDCGVCEPECPADAI